MFRSRVIVFSCLFFLLTRNIKSLFNSFNQSLSKRTYTKEQFYSMTMFLFLFLSLFQSNVQSAITQSSIFLPCNCTHAPTQSIHPMACHVVFIIWQKNLRHLSCMKKKSGFKKKTTKNTNIKMKYIYVNHKYWHLIRKIEIR